MPYITEITNILGDFKGWLYALIGIVTVIVIIIHALKYQGGDSAEKQDAIRQIRNTIIMGGAVFFLVWIATYVIERLAAVG
jgi:hypothetical protein